MTPIVLAIETAGANCSVAVACGAEIIAAERRPMRHGHGEALLPMVARVMSGAGLVASSVDATAVSVGPGGFTGIRVGIAAARGIALASGARLIGVTCFAAVAAAVGREQPEMLETRRAVLVALDSRRAELYLQLFAAGEPIGPPATLLPEDIPVFIGTAIGDAPLLIAGDAADAAARALARRAGFAAVSGSAPDAVGVWLAARGGAGLGDAAPLYLRPPDVTFPKRAADLDRAAVTASITALPLTAARPLSALHRACFPEDPWEPDALSRVLALSGCFGFVAWDAETPTGFVIARDLGDEGEILSLGVAPAWRRRGVGGALLHAAIAETRRRRLGALVLEVAADNDAARRLYQRLGFAAVGRRPRYYRRTEAVADALILRLVLAEASPSA